MMSDPTQDEFESWRRRPKEWQTALHKAAAFSREITQ
jgi:hypothetical protein